jgi:hypothetical protein
MPRPDRLGCTANAATHGPNLVFACGMGLSQQCHENKLHLCPLHTSCVRCCLLLPPGSWLLESKPYLDVKLVRSNTRPWNSPSRCRTMFNLPHPARYICIASAFTAAAAGGQTPRSTCDHAQPCEDAVKCCQPSRLPVQANVVHQRMCHLHNIARLRHPV